MNSQCAPVSEVLHPYVRSCIQLKAVHVNSRVLLIETIHHYICIRLQYVYDYYMIRRGLGYSILYKEHNWFNYHNVQSQ